MLKIRSEKRPILAVCFFNCEENVMLMPKGRYSKNAQKHCVFMHFLNIDLCQKTTQIIEQRCQKSFKKHTKNQ